MDYKGKLFEKRSSYGVKLMLPIGQILNFDNQKGFQNRETGHMHAPIYIVDSPKINENEDSEALKFTDNYITCALRDKTKYPEMSNLVKKVQTHHHTTIWV